MASKYSAKSNPSGSPTSASDYSEDLEERYGVHIDSEIEMVQDNISKLQHERRLLDNTIEALTDSMDEAEPGSPTYNEYQSDLDVELSNLYNLENAIRYHQNLDAILDDMDMGMGEYQAESLPANEIKNAMDELNDERNRLIEEIEDTGYQFW